MYLLRAHCRATSCVYPHSSRSTLGMSVNR